MKMKIASLWGISYLDLNILGYFSHSSTSWCFLAIWQVHSFPELHISVQLLKADSKLQIIHSFKKHLWSTCLRSGMVLDAGDRPPHTSLSEQVLGWQTSPSHAPSPLLDRLSSEQ